jgi:hypothetical protein
MSKSLFLTDVLAQTGPAFHFLFIVEEVPEPEPLEKRRG